EQQTTRPRTEVKDPPGRRITQLVENARYQAFTVGPWRKRVRGDAERQAPEFACAKNMGHGLAPKTSREERHEPRAGVGGDSLVLPDDHIWPVTAQGGGHEQLGVKARLGHAGVVQGSHRGTERRPDRQGLFEILDQPSASMAASRSAWSWVMSSEMISSSASPFITWSIL